MSLCLYVSMSMSISLSRQASPFPQQLLLYYNYNSSTTLYSTLYNILIQRFYYNYLLIMIASHDQE